MSQVCRDYPVHDLLDTYDTQRQTEGSHFHSRSLPVTAFMVLHHGNMALCRCTKLLHKSCIFPSQRLINTDFDSSRKIFCMGGLHQSASFTAHSVNFDSQPIRRALVSRSLMSNDSMEASITDTYANVKTGVHIQELAQPRLLRLPCHTIAHFGADSPCLWMLCRNCFFHPP